MEEENKTSFVNVIQENRFELNAYLNYLFNQFNEYVPKHMEDVKMMEQYRKYNNKIRGCIIP
ncbi:hypothetical protein SB775_21835 [Peribacillus sp. SIMBA_075]|uniref:hypothetical protein n=1 Tax=Peribacillus sp. SIMBA_075 TaxID=3085813 RepID=UPI00397BF170